MFAEGTIFYSSKKQHTISLSSEEVEYRAAVNAATQCVWLQGILWEFGVTIDSSTNILVENQSAIKIYTDLVQRHRTRHIDIHMHYIRGLVHDRVFSLQYFPSTEQTASIFTKAFTEKTFTYLRYLLQVSEGWKFFVISLQVHPHVHSWGRFFPCGFPSFLGSFGQIKIEISEYVLEVTWAIVAKAFIILWAYLVVGLREGVRIVIHY